MLRVFLPLAVVLLGVSPVPGAAQSDERPFATPPAAPKPQSQ
jgi:hypothetical protein